MSGGVGDIELSEQTALQADEEDGSIHADAGELNGDLFNNFTSWDSLSGSYNAQTLKAHNSRTNPN